MKMKRGLTILSAAALTLAMAGPVMAQAPVTRGAVQKADYGYFDEHPDVAQRLAKDPSLIDNQQFVDSHKGLREYLHNHPHVRHEFKSHPYKFMHHEDVYKKNHG
jgi:hypothetical protein